MMLRALFAAALACVAFQPEIAQAQPAILMIPLCKKIPDDSARLKCFDAMVADLVQKAPEEKVKAEPPQWQFDESKSPIDDSAQVLAALDSDDGDGTLAIRCQEKRTEVAFIHKRLFVIDKGTVIVRINDLQPASYTWVASNNNKALFAPSPMTLAKNLPDNGKLFIRAASHTISVDSTFQLGDMSAVRDRVGKACMWDVAAAPTAPAVAPPAALPTPATQASPPQPKKPIPKTPAPISLQPPASNQAK